MIRLFRIIVQNAAIIFVLMYIYGCFGMLLFHGALVRGNPKLIGTAYDAADYYELINFNDFNSSLLTLLHLIIVNNWVVTLRAVMTAVSPWACIYFLTFYYTMCIVFLNLATAYILEAVHFLSRKMEKHHTEELKLKHTMEEVWKHKIESVSQFVIDKLENELEEEEASRKSTALHQSPVFRE